LLRYEIVHRREQFLHVGKSQLAITGPTVLPEDLKLAQRDSLPLERVGLGEICLHVFNKAPRYSGGNSMLSMIIVAASV
jgi:hypothetical protein